LERGGLTPLLEKRSDWHSRSEFHNVTDLAVVLDSRTAAAVVFQLTRHQCDDRTRDRSKGRADRDMVDE
jgi:hypothetical protein